MIDIFSLKVDEIASKIKDAQLTSVEVCEKYIEKINKFEKILSGMDLIYNFSIYKFDNRNNFYKVIFNGTPDKFLEVMSDQNYDFEIKNKIWVLNDKS